MTASKSLALCTAAAACMTTAPLAAQAQVSISLGSPEVRNEHESYRA
jgi:hypothetical protein